MATGETAEAPETEIVTITPTMEVVIRHMLKTPRARFILVEVCRELGLYPGTVSPLLRAMADAGWLERKPGYRNKKYYKFTYGSSTLLRKAVGKADGK